MYRILTTNRKLKNRVKLIGIGVKDNDYNIRKYREAFKVQFPLFPDEDLVVHKQLGQPFTPFFICLKIIDHEKIDVFSTHLGKIPDIGAFINMLIDQGGLS